MAPSAASISLMPHCDINFQRSASFTPLPLSHHPALSTTPTSGSRIPGMRKANIREWHAGEAVDDAVQQDRGHAPAVPVPGLRRDALPACPCGSPASRRRRIPAIMSRRASAIGPVPFPSPSGLPYAVSEPHPAGVTVLAGPLRGSRRATARPEWRRSRRRWP